MISICSILYIKEGSFSLKYHSTMISPRHLLIYVLDSRIQIIQQGLSIDKQIFYVKLVWLSSLNLFL